MESNQAQVIRQDLRNFSGAVQNMVQGVRAAQAAERFFEISQEQY